MSVSPPRTTTSMALADPFPVSWQRLAAISGIVFGLLLVVTIVLGNADTPSYGDPVGKWTTYAVDNESKLRIGALVSALAAFEFLWFLGYLRGVLGAAELAARGFTRLTHVVFAAGITGIAGYTLGSLVNSASLFHAQDTDPHIIRATNQMAGPAFGLATVSFAAMLIAFAVLVLRTRPFAAWLAWLSLAAGVFFLLTLGILLSKDYDNGFWVFFPLAFLGLIVWSIACSVSFLRGLRAPVGAVDAPASRVE